MIIMCLGLKSPLCYAYIALFSHKNNEIICKPGLPTHPNFKPAYILGCSLESWTVAQPPVRDTEESVSESAEPNWLYELRGD